VPLRRPPSDRQGSDPGPGVGWRRGRGKCCPARIRGRREAESAHAARLGTRAAGSGRGWRAGRGAGPGWGRSRYQTRSRGDRRLNAAADASSQPVRLRRRRRRLPAGRRTRGRGPRGQAGGVDRAAAGRTPLPGLASRPPPGALGAWTRRSLGPGRQWPTAVGREADGGRHGGPDAAMARGVQRAPVGPHTRMAARSAGAPSGPH